MESSFQFPNFLIKLSKAIKTNDPKTVHEVLSKNSNLLNLSDQTSNFKSELNYFFLKSEIKNKKIEYLLVRFLQYAGQGADSYIESLLTSAIATGKVTIVESLLKSGAKLLRPHHTINIISHWIFRRRKVRKNMLKLLVKYGLDIGRKNDKNQNVLHLFIYFINKNDEDVVEVADFLTCNGISVDEQDNDGWTPLTHAVSKEHIPLVSYLIEKGADLNKKTISGCLSFHLAALNGSEDLVNLLILNGVDVNVTTHDGHTALHLACNYNDEKMIKFLIQKGANICAESNYGKTPLSLLNPVIDNYELCVTAVVKEFSRLVFENQWVSEYDADLILSIEMAREIFENCLSELEQISSTKFYCSYSYYSVLKMSENIKKLANLTKNEEFVEMFEKNLSNFSYYKNDLKNVYNEAIQLRNKLLSINLRLRSVFYDLFPDIVIRKLTNNLSLEDLPLN